MGAAMKRLGTVDLDTGELIDGTVALHTPKRQNGFVEGWIAMGLEALRDVAKAVAKGELQRNDLVVFSMLAGSVSYENHVATPQAELAAELGMCASHFSRSVANLMRFGAIEQGPKIGRVKTYRLSPAYGWRGSAKNHRDAMRKHLRTTVERSAQRKLKAIEGGQSCE